MLLIASFVVALAASSHGKLQQKVAPAVTASSSIPATSQPATHASPKSVTNLVPFPDCVPYTGGPLALPKVQGLTATTWPTADKVPPAFDALTLDTTGSSAIPVNTEANAVAGKSNGGADACYWPADQCINPTLDIDSCPDANVFGQTFDDGPTPFTVPLLDHLRQLGVKVTFFVVGSRVLDNPEVLLQAYQDGHEIAVHTWSHPRLSTLSNDLVAAELMWTELAIYAVTCQRPAYFRPPYGDVDNRVRTVAQQIGYKSVIWDQDTNDFDCGEQKSFNVNWVMGNVSQWVSIPSAKGIVALEHDIYQCTANAGMKVTDIILAANRVIAPISACNYDPYPYKNNQTAMPIVINGQYGADTVPATSASTITSTSTDNSTISDTSSLAATNSTNGTNSLPNPSSGSGTLTATTTYALILAVFIFMAC